MLEPMKITVETSYYEDMIKQRVDFGAGHVVERVVNLQDEGIREALLRLGWTPPGTDIAPGTRQALRGASPGQEKAYELGGVPGPMQYRVLEALAANNNGCTAVEIARRVNRRYESTHGAGTMKGAISGMQNYNQRHWVYPGERDTWYISDKGRKALEIGREVYAK